MMEPFEFGRYRVVAELGKGATGTVYLAESRDGRVALKILHRNLASDPVIRRRFRREAALARDLRHPGIVRVYDVIEHDGREALSMEYCPGGNLARLIAGTALAITASVEGPRAGLAAETAEDWLVRIAGALGFAHGRGWVHRAVKPENILLGDDGLPRLADFGSARLENLSGLTTSTTYLATPLYIAPEVMRGDPCRPAHDLYSLGAVFYRLLGGRPHREGGLASLLTPDGAAYVPLAELRPDLPPRLSSLVDALLSPLETRPGSAGAVVEALRGRPGRAETPVKRCLFCDAPMPADSPFCIACGEPDCYPDEYRGDDAEALVLTKLGESAGTMDSLYRFLRAWSGDSVKRWRFVTEDKRLYGKDELKGYLALPYPLLNWLSPETAVRLIAAFEVKGHGGLHLERKPAGKIQKKADKKPPVLSTRRPAAYKPIGSGVLAVRYGAAPTVAPGVSRAAGASAEADASGALGAIVFDCQRMADLLAGYKVEATDRLRRFVVRCGALADDMERFASALDGVSLPDLYAEETRLELALAEDPSLGLAERRDIERRLERNGEAWRRYEELEAAYARAAHRLEEIRRGVSDVTAGLGDALRLWDPAAHSHALAAFDELMAEADG